MSITRGPESDDGTQHESAPGFCGNCGAIITQTFCSQCGTRRAVGPALILPPEAPRVAAPGSTVPDQEDALSPAVRGAAFARLRRLKRTTRVGIAAGTVAAIGVISWAAIGSSSGGSVRGSGKYQDYLAIMKQLDTPATLAADDFPAPKAQPGDPALCAGSASDYADKVVLLLAFAKSKGENSHALVENQVAAVYVACPTSLNAYQDGLTSALKDKSLSQKVFDDVTRAAAAARQ